jgi:hypothetical protein
MGLTNVLPVGVLTVTPVGGRGLGGLAGALEALLPWPTAISVPMIEIMLTKTVFKISNSTTSFGAWLVIGWVTNIKQYNTPKQAHTKQITKPIWVQN